MAKTYNGRFKIDRIPGKGTGWLVLAVFLMFGGFAGIVLGCLSLCKYFSCRGKYNLYERFLSYCAVIGRRDRISVGELSKTSGRVNSDVRRDLQTMIAKGYFGSGAYFDADGDCLVIEDLAQSTGENWKDAVLELVHAIRDDFGMHDAAEDAQYQKAAPEAKESAEAKQKPAADPKKTYMDELERTLNELYQLNMQIEDAGVSRRIDRIGELTGGIFRAVIENPGRESEVRKFMNYYLPTTLKLLKSYDLMENQSYQGENITASRRKIEDVLDLLIAAYEKQLDRLFSNDALDIATDIDVLETMMAGDGLSAKGTMQI